MKNKFDINLTWDNFNSRLYLRIIDQKNLLVKNKESRL